MKQTLITVFWWALTQLALTGVLYPYYHARVQRWYRLRSHTAKHVLWQIDEWLNDPKTSQAERSYLWDVLSALRGPDNGDSRIKSATTAVIRHHAFPNASQVNVPALTNQDHPGYMEIRETIYNKNAETDEVVSYHFVRHAKEAFTALGLDWNKNNDPL